jgi:hypothetical protein
VAVYCPCKCIMNLNVLPSSKIGELRKPLGLEDCHFVFNGQILGLGTTFKSHKIKAKDTLVVIPGGTVNAEVEKWRSWTEDKERFNERLRLVMRSDTTRETARIRDVMMTRLERKPRQFRRICGAMMSAPATSRSAGKWSSNFDYEGGAAPSCAPLPIFWSQIGDAEGLLDNFPQASAILTVKQEQTDSVMDPIRP